MKRLILAALVGFIIMEIVALSPTRLGDLGQVPSSIDTETLAKEFDDTSVIATGIPKNEVADYSVDDFQYVSTQNGEKQWKLLADRAFLYNKHKLVHARKIHAFLIDPDGKTTVITGLEAKYYMNQRDLEIFGNVKAVFSDGFELTSEYMRYQPNQRRVSIPVHYEVQGIDRTEDGQKLSFKSHGMEYSMETSIIVLEQSAVVRMEKAAKSNEETGGVPDVTTIKSDRCQMYRQKQLALFTMNPNRRDEEKFVHISQPKLLARGRRANLNYGNFSKVLQYLVAYDDVLIQEIPEGQETAEGEPTKYGTGGRADFDTKRDVIILTQYPQVYQGDDTVIGDVILLHRDTDIVEVEHSNGFSQGSTSPTGSR